MFLQRGPSAGLQQKHAPGVRLLADGFERNSAIAARGCVRLFAGVCDPQLHRWGCEISRSAHRQNLQIGNTSAGK